MNKLRISNPLSFDCFQSMKGFKAVNFSLSAAIAVIGFAASPLLALPNNGGGLTTRGTLETGGYLCGHLPGTNLVQCSKPGGNTYWCDNSGECQPAPTQKAPTRKLPTGNLPQIQQVPTGN